MSTPAFKQLILLWWAQKRHSFHWQQIFLAVYFGGLYISLVLALYFGLREEMDKHPLPVDAIMYMPMLAVSVQLGDLLLKLFWRKSPVEMDDYLRTRPVAPRDWTLFVLVDTMLGFLQWILPLAVAFVVALILPWWAALLTLVLVFTVSIVNAQFQNCWRRAPGNEQTLPLVFGYLFWTGLLWLVAMTGILLPNFLDDAGVSLLAVITSVVMLALNGLVGYLLNRYFTFMKNYNEEQHAPVSVSARSLGQVSLWSIEWVQLLRSKRLRTSFIFIAVIFLFNVYTQQLTSDAMQQDLGIGVNPMLLFSVGFPTIILAQWVLGIEANFFSGIWTKPWGIEGILRRKYYFFCGLCCLMALCLLPACIWLHLSPLSLLATLLFSCGVFVLPFMATCLYSSRMDLFASAFFNYQGGNKQLNFFSFILFIPMIIYYATYFLLSPLWAHALIAGLGLLGLALHTLYIRWITGLWHKRRYQIMERWQTE